MELECLDAPNLRDRYSGIVRLWICVLYRAMSDWVLYRDSPRQALNLRARRAEQWLFHDKGDAGSIGSLAFVCDLCGIRRETAQAQARRMTPADVKRLEHQGRSPTRRQSAAGRQANGSAESSGDLQVTGGPLGSSSPKNRSN
jgi:hypothetical protein